MGSALKAGWNQQELLAGKPVQEKEEKSTTVAVGKKGLFCRIVQAIK